MSQPSLLKIFCMPMREAVLMTSGAMKLARSPASEGPFPSSPARRITTATTTSSGRVSLRVSTSASLRVKS